MRALIYSRISDARDGDTAGVDRQEADCRELCERNGWDVAGVFIDNSRSAFSGKARPRFEAMMKAIDAGEGDVIVCWAADRLYRRMSDLELLVDRLGKTQVATVRSGLVNLSTADGRMTARILGTVAQHESEKKGERIGRAHHERVRNGGWAGGPRRYGYNADASALVSDEAANVREAYERIADGGSINGLINDWRKRQVLTTTGKEWTAYRIRKLLLRPMNGGHVDFKGDVIENASKAPAIVEAALWARVKAILTDPSRPTYPAHKTGAGRPPTTLLSGILQCGVCGHWMRSQSRGRNGTVPVPIYRCHYQRCVSRRREYMDPYVVALMFDRFDERRDDLLGTAAARRSGADSNAQAVAIVEASRLRTDLASLPGLLSAGSLGAADFAAASSSLRARLAEVEAQISFESKESAIGRLLQAGDMRKTWDGYPVSDKRDVLKEMLVCVRVDKVANRGTRGSTYEGVMPVWRELG